MTVNKDFISHKINKQVYSNEVISDEEKLKKVASKAIRTTMIGALDTVEKHFGFLWNHGSFDTLSPEEEQMKAIYEQVRLIILDNGNDQIRNLGKALSQEYRTMNLPVKAKD